jgi:DNA-binding NarL/FixJ family response regulator
MATLQQVRELRYKGNLAIKDIAEQLGISVHTVKYQLYHRYEGGERLSPSELKIARLTADGLKECEVALTLRISKKTVSAHKVAIYEKLKVSNAVQMIKALRNKGLLAG